jgi:RNA polymerase sigma-70 factor (ECF subfamily)
MTNKFDREFEDILEKNKLKIFRICKIYAVSPIEPQDLFQEVILQIWTSLSKYQGKASIDTWVYKIALNVCMRSKMKLDVNNKNTERFESIHFHPSEKSIDHSEDEIFKYLHECISTLNELDASLMVLYLDGLAYKKVAIITGLTENHIAVKMKRIRKTLMDCINPKLL